MRYWPLLLLPILGLASAFIAAGRYIDVTRGVTVSPAPIVSTQVDGATKVAPMARTPWCLFFASAIA